MHHPRRLPLLLPSLAFGLLCSATRAQDPDNGPPWWGVADDVTVSLYWSFDAPFPPGQPTLQPDFAVVPPWYNNPVPVTAWTASTNLTHIPLLGGNFGALGLVSTGGTQQASLGLTVDNDPHLDWIKIFWFQFEEFEGANGSVSSQIMRDLSQYGRANVTETREDLGTGWELVTINAQLVPQPDDEHVDWSFVVSGAGTAAIDNLYVSSKCVKPRPDEDGDAMGMRIGQEIDLTVVTGGATCRAVAVTRGSGTQPGRRYWVSALGMGPTNQHQIFQLNSLGAVVGTPTLVPSTSLQAPLGVTDLAVETREVGMGSGVFQETVYGIVDNRSTGGLVNILTLDPTAPTTVGSIPLPGFPAIAGNQRFGLAFDESGDLGDGTFWVSAPQTVTPQGTSPWFEFSRGGQLLDTRFVSERAAGIAYDDTLGNFYTFSREPIMTPSGATVRVNGAEISGFGDAFRETGVRFCGDLTQPNSGGLASGLDVYRTLGNIRSELRLVCVVDVPGGQVLYELAGPYRYGYSRFGTCGMRNGPPFVGGSFDITLSGVPTSALAVLFLGSDDQIVPLNAGPFPEAIGSILPGPSAGPLAPVQPGEFALTVNLPNSASLAYSEAYFQWVVLDSTAPGLLGFSQAGKTVIYP